MSMRDYVTFQISDQTFGVETLAVQDVFIPRLITPVPLARPEILGVLNLRGRVVTAVCGRSRLGMAPRAAGAFAPKAIGIEIAGDNYGLVVDRVEAVVKLDADDMIAPPSHLPPRWTEVIDGVFRLPDDLLVILNIKRLLIGDASSFGAAA